MQSNNISVIVLGRKVRTGALGETEPRQPVAVTGAAQGNRQLVADQFATAVSQDRRAVGKACAVLLALAGQESSDAAAICADAR